MRMADAPDGIWEENRASGAKVGVVGGAGGLIVGGEIICHSEAIGGRELDEAIAIFCSTGIGIERSVSDFEVEVGGGVHERAIATHPEAAFAGVGAPGGHCAVW